MDNALVHTVGPVTRTPRGLIGNITSSLACGHADQRLGTLRRFLPSPRPRARHDPTTGASSFDQWLPAPDRQMTDADDFDALPAGQPRQPPTHRLWTAYFVLHTL